MWVALHTVEGSQPFFRVRRPLGLKARMLLRVTLNKPAPSMKIEREREAGGGEDRERARGVTRIQSPRSSS